VENSKPNWSSLRGSHQISIVWPRGSLAPYRDAVKRAPDILIDGI
jgi:hypothetical protein